MDLEEKRSHYMIATIENNICGIFCHKDLHERANWGCTLQIKYTKLIIYR